MTHATSAAGEGMLRRVFDLLALGKRALAAMVKFITSVRVLAYEERLAEIAARLGLAGARRLTDTTVLRRIERESRDVAAGIIRTHNDDLRAWLARQPRRREDGTAVTQQELVTAAKAWLAARADARTRRITRTEGMAGRNAAALDVLRMNEAKVRVRAEPRSSGEPRCAAIVAHGWYEVADAPRLPAHPNCVHAWAYDTSLTTALEQRDRIWLGEWRDNTA